MPSFCWSRFTGSPARPRFRIGMGLLLVLRRSGQRAARRASARRRPPRLTIAGGHVRVTGARKLGVDRCLLPAGSQLGDEQRQFSSPCLRHGIGSRRTEPARPLFGVAPGYRAHLSPKTPRAPISPLRPVTRPGARRYDQRPNPARSDMAVRSTQAGGRAGPARRGRLRPPDANRPQGAAPARPRIAESRARRAGCPEGRVPAGGAGARRHTGRALGSHPRSVPPPRRLPSGESAATTTRS